MRAHAHDTRVKQDLKIKDYETNGRKKNDYHCKTE